ncbi:MAG TPA: MGMT family protein [Virgibacillus sp.]|nr:MGMT family protein [Virgibacillus sp.]
MEAFTEKVIAIIKNIPEGRVMTYGQIARLAGTPRGARQVARILHSMSRKHHLPWHRVINVQGKLTIKDEALYLEQKMSLESEGVACTGGRVNLHEFQFTP